MFQLTPAPTWFRVLVPCFHWVGLGVVSGLFLELLGLSSTSLPIFVAAAATLGGGMAGITFLSHQVRPASIAAVKRAFPWILLVGYPWFGLLISGASLAIVAPRVPYDSEARLLVFLLGLYGPAYGILALATGLFLQPRSWLLKFFEWAGKRQALCANLAIAAGFLLLAWGTAFVRYEIRTPNDLDLRHQHAREQQQWQRLEAVGEQKRSIVSEFLRAGPSAAAFFVQTEGGATQTKRLEKCVDSSPAVVECAVLDHSGSYSALRESLVAQCGYCERGPCDSSPAGNLGARSFTIDLGEHEFARVAASSDAAWAEPTIMGGAGCEEITYLTPLPEGHLAVTLSLARLSEQLKVSPAESTSLPQFQAYVTDDRGYLVATSITDRYRHDGSYVGLCMIPLDCGGRAEGARAAALQTFANGKSRFSLGAQRYARWLGFGAQRNTSASKDEPRWLLTLLSLGPDIHP